MWLNNIIVTIAIIVLIPDYTTCKCQYQKNISKHETENCNEKYVFHNYSDLKQNTEYVKDKKIIPNLFFGDVLANKLREFIVFSNINEKCTKDGQHFVTEFNNQTLWAVQSM